jgi:hypothetical protein
MDVVKPDQLDAAELSRHPPVIPCELPDGIKFGLAKAFRKPPAYRGQRNFPGWWWSATTRSHVLYESWLERHHVI